MISMASQKDLNCVLESIVFSHLAAVKSLGEADMNRNKIYLADLVL